MSPWLRSSPLMCRSSVLLPAPLRPTMTTSSPLRRFRLTSRSRARPATLTSSSLTLRRSLLLLMAACASCGRAAAGTGRTVLPARGDETALTISRQAGTELARLANVALQRLGVILPVGLAGGVLNLGEPLLEAFRAALPVGCEIRISDTDPAAAAAQLAVRLRSADPSN